MRTQNADLGELNLGQIHLFVSSLSASLLRVPAGSVLVLVRLRDPTLRKILINKQPLKVNLGEICFSFKYIGGPSSSKFNGKSPLFSVKSEVNPGLYGKSF